ncbi:MAG: hypothetical protein AB8B87_25520 [Granulosicoccus sp.]
MRNYFKALRLTIRAPRDALIEALAIGSPTAKEITPRHRVDAYDILLDEDRRDLYANTAEVYEGMYIASQRLNESVGMDTNRWKDRLANFDTAVEDSIEL